MECVYDCVLCVCEGMRCVWNMCESVWGVCEGMRFVWVCIRVCSCV